MSITLDPKTEQAVAEEVRKTAENVRNLILRELSYAGEQAVNVARSVVSQGGYLGSGRPYTVQTGNLTSSVGYCITEEGRIVQMSSFEVVNSGQEGSLVGRQLAMQVAKQYPQGYALILVAGMHYASYVQELHSRDVLASATLIAEKLVNDLKTKLAK